MARVCRECGNESPEVSEPPAWMLGRLKEVIGLEIPQTGGTCLDCDGALFSLHATAEQVHRRMNESVPKRTRKRVQK